MPNYFAHRAAAQIIYGALPGDIRSRITSPDLYNIGAQGADLYFCYNATPTERNLGRALHAAPAGPLFAALSRGDFSYCAGYITHYAVDSMFHPAVYAFAEGKSFRAHSSLERDIGLFYGKTYGAEPEILPRDTLLSVTGEIYASMRNYLPDITLRRTETCVKRHYVYSKYLLDHKIDEYKNDYDFGSLVPIAERACSFAVEVIESVSRGVTDGELFSRKFLEGKPVRGGGKSE